VKKVDLPVVRHHPHGVDMRSFSKVLLAAAGAFALLVTAPLALPAHVHPDAKGLAKLDDDWSKAAVAKDVERVASFYADDAIAYPPNEPMASGKAAAKKVWAAYFADPTFAISWKTEHAEVAGELGYTSGPYESSFKGPDGKTVSEKGKYVCVWRKQKDGGWKAIHDIWNADSK
jgi:ketosteroid isomerase-like protein